MRPITSGAIVLTIALGILACGQTSPKQTNRSSKAQPASQLSEVSMQDNSQNSEDEFAKEYQLVFGNDPFWHGHIHTAFPGVRRWGRFGPLGIYGVLRNDSIYNAFLMRAEAALIKAKAAARKDNEKANAIAAMVRDAEVEIKRLRIEMKKLRTIEERFSAHLSSVRDLVGAEGLNKNGTIKHSLYHLIYLSGMETTDLISIDVDPISADQFSPSRKAKAFEGGSLRAYLSFLDDNPGMNLDGDAAFLPIVNLYDEIAKRGEDNLREMIDGMSEDISEERRQAWENLVKLIDAMENDTEE